MVATICRKAHFNAAHRLHVDAWDDAKNQEVFGKCNNPNFHGHNYELIVKITGQIQPETGYVMDTKLVKDLVEKEVVERFDHKNLNLDTREFEELNPTAENIAAVIYRILRPSIPEDRKLGIVLYETDRNYVEFNG
ncbi:6-pyruvoyl tetrahydropterin synthase family protein [Paradesertivirga mongoliensis]|uniref:6-carboxy-5,6,7,8-tetrahydropterin synthase n=1 Tax=Paradesertivirga mongoliensis TaxID=2100740 RepID=A0ABW4ZLS0_9SPHI|nr:6-carboxytetrahydropterin synthase [Pedobacter mongoliensis]